MSPILHIDTNAHALGARLEALGSNLRDVNYGLARDAMADVAQYLVSSVQTTMLSQQFRPLSEVTTEYKRRKGLDPRILFATGRAFAGIEGDHGGTWAKAYRGRDDWWMFLHDRGVGVAHWSREGTARAGASKARRHRDRKQMSEGRVPLAQAGLTRFPERQMFVITPGAQTAILNRIELFLQAACDEVGNAAA